MFGYFYMLVCLHIFGFFHFVCSVIFSCSDIFSCSIILSFCHRLPFSGFRLFSVVRLFLFFSCLVISNRRRRSTKRQPASGKRSASSPSPSDGAWERLQVNFLFMVHVLQLHVYFEETGINCWFILMLRNVSYRNIYGTIVSILQVIKLAATPCNVCALSHRWTATFQRHKREPSSYGIAQWVFRIWFCF